MTLEPDIRRDIERELDALPAELRGPALLRLGESLAAEDRHAEAAEALELAAAALAGHDDEAAAVALVDVAGLLARSGQPAEALERLRRLAPLPPACLPRGLFTLGCIYATLEEDDEARAAFEQAAAEYDRLRDKTVEGSAWLVARLDCLVNAAACTADPDDEALRRAASFADELERIGEHGRAAHARAVELSLRMAAADRLPAPERREACREVVAAADSLRRQFRGSVRRVPAALELDVDLVYARALAECGEGRAAREALADVAARLERRGDAWRAAKAYTELAVLEHAALAHRRDLGQAERHYRAALDALESALYGSGVDEIRIEARRERVPDPASGLCRLWIQQRGRRDARVGGAWLLTERAVLEDVLEVAERGRSALLRAELGEAPSGGGSVPPASAGAIAASLRPDEALIAYALTHDDRAQGLIALAVDASGVRWATYRPGAGTAALSLASGLRAEIQAAERAEYPDGSPWISRDASWDVPLAELGRLLLADVVALEPGWLAGEKRRLVLVPTGPLHELPLAALTVPDERGGRLVERVAVVCDPQVSARARIAERLRGGSRDALLLLDGDRSGLDHAPAVLQAAQTLAARLGGETRRLDGAPQPSLECALLLLYGHGTFDHRDPHASGIRYADGSGAVRRLAAADLARSGMRADVAIAAACESGRARASRGDALFGYRRALLGVSRCAVSTLWSVYEPATAGIVRALLNGMAEGSPAPDALRAAQLAAMSGQLEAIGYDPAHPFYWAGLVCAGEPIALVPETRG